jgi:hypothetical protein
VGDYCRKMKSTIGLHDLGVHGPGARPSSQRSAGPSQQLRGRADAAHAPAVNTHLPLQVRDALTLELTRPPPTHTCLDYVFSLVLHLSRTRRCPTTVLRLAARLSPWCSSPRAERGWMGPWGPPRTRWGVVGRPPRLRPLLSLLFPEVRPGRTSLTRGHGVSPCGPTGSGRGASSPAPACGHGHECHLLRADLDPTPST